MIKEICNRHDALYRAEKEVLEKETSDQTYLPSLVVDSTSLLVRFLSGKMIMNGRK
jgi:hypothetical protein